MPCIAGNIQIAICHGYYIGTSLWAWLAGKLVNLSTDLWRRVYSLAAADHDPCHPSYADFSHTKTELAALGVLIQDRVGCTGCTHPQFECTTQSVSQKYGETVSGGYFHNFVYFCEGEYLPFEVLLFGG